MRKIIFPIILLCVIFINIAIFAKSVKNKKKVNNDFIEIREDSNNFTATGKNSYFILEPGFELVYEGNEDGEKVKLVITVLNETKKLGEIETRVVEEREWKNGELAEVSKNFFAISKKTNNAYYFGEEVDLYKNGKIDNHNGSWLHGRKGAKYGLIMPAIPKIGTKYLQENAPGEAMDYAEVLSVSETLKTPAGDFKNCMKTKESSLLYPAETEYKLYAPEIGLLNDGDLLLVKYGFIKK